MWKIYKIVLSIIKMNNEQPPNSPDLEDLKRIIGKIKTKGNLAGVLLSYDDGTLVAEDLEKKAQKEIPLKNFNPMLASVLKSGEKLSKTVGGRDLVKIVAQLKNYSIILVKFNDKELFLALLIDHFSEVGFLLDNFDEKIGTYIQKIKKCV